MVQRVQIQLTDDLDGADIPHGAGETVPFALDGQAYEIDLSDKNADVLRKVLAPYLEFGRRVRTSRGTRVRRTQVGPSASTLREWARVNGYEVSDRGRVSSHVRDAFEAAN